MSAIRLPLLCAFAGGCLSNALLFSLWRPAAGAGDSALEQQRRPHHVVELVTAGNSASSVAQPSGLVAAVDGQRQSAAIEAVAAPASDLDSSRPTPAGSAVSDVLTRLEAAYRERVAAPNPAQLSPTPERAASAASTASAVAAAQAAPSAPAQPVAEVVPAMPVVSAAITLAPATLAPATLAPATLAPVQVAAVPAVAAQDPPPPTEIHYGDINQNTYVTNVREGDVYLVQMQQVAMLQYLQLLGISSGAAAPARHVGGAGHQRGALATGITNPDNPWGFHFAPPNLVR